MLVWRGWGIIALLIAGAGGGIGTGIGVALGGASDTANAGTAIGLALAAVALWFVGRRLNAPRAGFHPESGQPVQYRNQHTFMFIPIQWLAPALATAAVLAAASALRA